MSESDIGELLVLTASGNTDAFSQLYKNTARGIYAFLYTYLNNAADTEDAMQTVYLKIAKSANTFKKGTNGRAWIFQIAKNHALSELKKRGREIDIEQIAEPTVKEYGGTIVDAMNRALNKEEQRLIILHVLWGYKHREIAKMNDCPVGTITSKYKRAMEKLRKALKEI
ncbi:MAG: RNA polymerase sigma factor [Clostridia bacterium]|nr:RNA polymerase sigma factor [Clostridia bacterium]